ncbi:MAG: prolipoprotein diacylglyceryl transferase [Roseburia sp.]|nr:prolipoprotein diacylglyceryl transferase [Roseburia sp.]
MYNDLFSIGPITIHSYGVMIAIGVLAALYMGEARAKKRGMNADVLYVMTFLCVFFGFFCAKLLFILVEFKSFLNDPGSLFSNNGYVVYGGIIGGVLIAYVYCRIKKLRFIDYFDIVLPSVAVAQGFGRIGCFMAGCCYGRETQAWYGIAFTHSHFAPNGVKLIPTQLISSAGMFAIAGILLWYAHKPKKPGRVGALYLILYSTGRFCVEFLRNDYRGEIGPLSTSQFISIFIFAIGIFVFMTRKDRV